MQQVEYEKAGLAQHQKSDAHSRIQEYKGNRSSNYLSTCQSTTSILDQQLSPINETGLCSTLPLCSAPLCRQFWKAGSYEDGLASKPTLQNGSSYLHVHPKFLHSNATSHKWAFGAIAELLDNAVDEIQNGATFVLVDKTLNPRDGCPALLIQDDGGGMDPEAMRCCLSFGFSDKKSKSAIGQYGNGFKTSTMRLGADVVVFSRHLKERKLTQSIGLLSYTFLTQTGHDRIVVPMVDYEFDASTGAVKTSDRHGKEHFISNLSMLLQWSPYSTEADLLQQFDDIGYRGTKVIIYNLWLNNEGTVELDFDSDPEDIRLSGDANCMEKSMNQMAISGQHMANKLRYSLRVYLSILYLRIPESFSIMLRGRVVEYHNIASDLKFPEFILYRPQNGGRTEGAVVTAIGFLKEAPHVNIRGFNVYHKNRLILPFWHVVSYNDNRGRGVVGVLEANFIEPTHNKQDFEKTSVFQKLENRLKEMTWEYWDYHCGLLGYQVKKKLRTSMPSLGSIDSRPHNFMQQLVVSDKSSSIAATTRALPKGEQLKRKECQYLAETEQMRKRAGGGVGVGKLGTGINQEMQPALATGNQLEDPKAIKLIRENKRLRALCLEHEKREEELSVKVTELRSKLGELQRVYSELLTESGLS